MPDGRRGPSKTKTKSLELNYNVSRHFKRGEQRVKHRWGKKLEF